jgi:hypothetical protein
MSRIIDIADAVAAALNAAPPETFSQPVAAIRRNVPTFDVKELAELVVCVAPKGIAEIPATRALFQADYRIDVGVLKRLAAIADATDPPDQAEIDTLLSFTEELRRFCRTLDLSIAVPYPGASVQAMSVKAENEPIYWPDHVRELRQFTSVLTLTIRVIE